MNTMSQKIKKDLFELKDDKYKEFHSSLCPGINNIIGIRVPILRSYAKDITKQNWREYIKNIDNEYYEEKMLKGMIIGLVKCEFDERKEHIENFVPLIDNWAICDTFCAGLKNTKKDKKQVWDLIEKYLNSKEEFELRFAIVMILDYYITDEYLNIVLEKLNNVKSDYYYVKMAVAWAISIAYIKYPEITIDFLKNNNLDEFTHNKAIQKILESLRVENSQKEQIKNLKIK